MDIRDINRFRYNVYQNDDERWRFQFSNHLYSYGFQNPKCCTGTIAYSSAERGSGFVFKCACLDVCATPPDPGDNN